MWVANLDGSPAVVRNSPPPFFKVAAFWIPRQFIRSDGADVNAYVTELNHIIANRGYVLWDYQILTTPIDAANVELVFEGDHAYDAPPQRPWTPALRDYFGLNEPYQMAENASVYTTSHIMTRVFEPYLRKDEQIAGLLHGITDDYYFYCPCHEAAVVYTTGHRLICMGCGALHAVLDSPLSIDVRKTLTAEQWDQYFDRTGARNEEEVDLTLVDFRDVEFREMIWATDSWEDACHRFKFFARCTPEEIEAATRNTEADMSAFLEAGFQLAEMTPTPAYQLSADSIDVDLVENAGHALRAGAAAYLAAGTNSDQLVHAVPQLFRCIELLLKAKLQDLSSSGIADNPNNPTVLKRLHDAGVSIPAAEDAFIKRLRQLRNRLQHGTASFNYRAGKALCREAIVFLDRFSIDELNLWIGDAFEAPDWQRILSIPELSATADRVASARLQSIAINSSAEISKCEHCGKDAYVRPVPGSGASCIRCGYIATRIGRSPSNNGTE